MIRCNIPVTLFSDRVSGIEYHIPGQGFLMTYQPKKGNVYVLNVFQLKEKPEQ